MALKLLAKLGALPRMHEAPLKMLTKESNLDPSEVIQAAFTSIKTEKKVKLPMVTAIEYAS